MTGRNFPSYHKKGQKNKASASDAVPSWLFVLFLFHENTIHEHLIIRMLPS